MLPALFVSHGAPTLLLEDVPARRFLAGLAGTLPERPASILAVSAHWETAVPAVNAVAVNATIDDFFGFPPALHEATYPAPGSADLAGRVAGRLAALGLEVAIDRQRGLDRGAWVPLALAFPAHDLPVVQLSVQTALGPEHHLRLGRALAPLRGEGVLILGSGSFTHDLSEFRTRWKGEGEADPPWVTDFAAWMDAALVDGRTDDVLGYRRLAPHAVRNHPTEEHLLPLHVALGAGGPDARARRLHASTTYGVLRMDAYAFD